MMHVRYVVLMEQRLKDWTARVPDLPGCTSKGNTMEEAETNIRGAIEKRIRELRGFGQPVPRPTTLAAEVEIALEE